MKISFLPNWANSLVGIICAIICGYLAKKKNRSIIGWVFWGFISGPIAVVIISLLSPNTDSDEGTSDEAKKKECPNCHDKVEASKKKCPFCGYLFDVLGN